jgi:hypothetical protein
MDLLQQNPEKPGSPGSARPALPGNIETIFLFPVLLLQPFFLSGNSIRFHALIDFDTVHMRHAYTAVREIIESMFWLNV